MDGFAAIFFFVILVVVLAQVFTGTVIDRSWKPWIRRKDSPAAIWLAIGFQLALVLACGITWFLHRQ
jgi:hypothetical protein